MTSFSIQTFGCRVNQAEAFLWADELQRQGLKYEKDFASGDIVLINSCTLTSRADSDVRNFIRRASRLNPEAKLIVTGCYAERATEELARMKEVWRILTNAEKDKIIKDILILSREKEAAFVSPFRSRAYLKIQDGCNFRCSFCIIPSVRGRSVSSTKKNVLSEMEKFIRQGFDEIVLTGIHLCSYGADLKPRSTLLQLLQEVEQLEGLTSVRLSSLDPGYLKLELIEFLSVSEKICPHFHLSLQSGSEEILRRMGRMMKVEDYRGILSTLRKRSSLASLGADIIVGFPGETESDFQQTVSFLEESPLTYFHVFSYSPRPGTVAASWPQIDGKVKKERARLLRGMSARKNMKFRQLLAGKVRKAIVIKKSKDGIEVLTDNYVRVLIPPLSCKEGQRLKVRITGSGKKITTGQLSEAPCP